MVFFGCEDFLCYWVWCVGRSWGFFDKGFEEVWGKSVRGCKVESVWCDCFFFIENGIWLSLL